MFVREAKDPVAGLATACLICYHSDILQNIHRKFGKKCSDHYTEHCAKCNKCSKKVVKKIHCEREVNG